jgi:hypothetical protein
VEPERAECLRRAARMGSGLPARAATETFG